MFIYIDESGTFAYPQRGGHSYACAGALTIPDRFHDKALKLFKRCKSAWNCVGEEPKGSHLAEDQVAEVIDLLLICRARFHVCATDMTYNSPDAVATRKTEQADRLLANITPQHNPALVAQFKDYQLKMNALSNQLFVQLCVMTTLVIRHLQDIVVYYALTDPPELGQFRWNVDRKDNTKTTYEDIWGTLLWQFIQGVQVTHNPRDWIVCIEGGDYSHFEKYCDRIDKWPRHLHMRRPEMREAKGVDVINISKILRDSFVFGDSASTPGLQLCDIVTNAFRRAISGRLQYGGWKDLGRLMFRRDNQSACFVQLEDETKPSISIEENPCAEVVMAMTRVAGDPLGDYQVIE
ncbi:MAG: DUF3800 domain-containing protein [Candidatus Scalindua sp.]